MNEMEKELRKISKALSGLAKRLDRFSALAGGNKRGGAMRKRVAPRKQMKAPAKTAANVIMGILKARKKGADAALIRAKTGYGGQKVRSILWELSKKREIERIGRGLYRLAK